MPSVLIVDDHVRFRTTARRWLTRAGFDVIGEAADGAEALEAAARLRPDIVLLDVQLPDMDGFEIAAQLTLNGAPGSLVILTSTRDEAEFGDLVAQCGAAGFIPKAELARRLRWPPRGSESHGCGRSSPLAGQRLRRPPD